jgi:hypothetical protein
MLVTMVGDTGYVLCDEIGKKGVGVNLKDLNADQALASWGMAHEALQRC